MKALMFNIPIGLREGSVKMGGASTNSFFAPTEDEIPRSNVVGRNALLETVNMQYKVRIRYSNES